jgi:hypothetical protein
LPVANWEWGIGRWQFWLGAVVFILLATANGAGYRYGTSDQAFYIPVVIRALQPAAFPRDASLIDSQGRLMLADEAIAALVRLTGLPLDVLFLAGYLLSLVVIWGALTAIGRRLYPSAWATVALVAAFTLRHRIPRTSANSFEPYFHPRMLAFGVGALAVAALLRRQFWLAIGLVALTGVLHVTTGLWFAILVGVAIARLDRNFRRLAAGAVMAAVVLLTWAGVAGPLRGSFVTMDAAWLAAVAGKGLFATEWPLWAWIANLALIVIAWMAHRRHPDRTALEGLLWGATALVALFLATLPLVSAAIAFPVQLQISRVFWLVDFVALLSVLGLARGPRTARVVAVALAAIAVGRGVYVMAIERPDRALFAVHLPATEWNDAMAWLNSQPIDVHILAHPGHAWKYGTSVRVSAERDVFIEEVKDSAIAIYSRDVALRYNERIHAIGDFDQITDDHARDLAARYRLDVLVAETDLSLPVAYRNSRFKVYSLAPATAAASRSGAREPFLRTATRRTP